MIQIQILNRIMNYIYKKNRIKQNYELYILYIKEKNYEL